MKLREFTKSDWHGFAGAEEFSDGSQPLIGHYQTKLVHIIVLCSKDTTEIEVYCDRTDTEDNFIINNTTEQIGKYLANSIYEGLEQFGKDWRKCSEHLKTTWGIEFPELELPEVKVTRFGTYGISNCLALEIFKDSEDNWFIKRNVEDAELEKTQFICETDRSGLMWGEIFIDFNEVICDGLLEPVYGTEIYEEEHYTSSSTAGDYSPSCPWNAPGMSVRDFI